MDPVKLEIEINEAALRNKRASSKSEIGFKTNQELNTAGAFAKTGNGAAKDIYFVDQHGSIYTKCTRFASDQLGNGNAYKDADPKQLEVARTNEVEFKIKKINSVPKIRSSTAEELQVGYSVVISPKTAEIERLDGSHEVMDLQNPVLERHDEVEFRDKPTHVVSKIGSSTRHETNKGYTVGTSNKTSQVIGNVISTFEDNNSNPDKGKKSSLSTEEEEHEEVEIIDEAEFLKMRTPFPVKIGSSTRQERHTECSAVNSPKTAHVMGNGNEYISLSVEDDCSGSYLSISSEKGSEDEAEFRNVLKKRSATRQESNKKISSYQMIGRKQGFVGYSSTRNNSSPDMVSTSSVPGMDMDRGIASRTRSKSMALKKSSESLRLLERTEGCNKKEGNTLTRVSAKRRLSSPYKDGENNCSQTKQLKKTEVGLPSKFRFEDVVPTQLEKAEHERDRNKHMV